jgi:hypothetical protein
MGAIYSHRALSRDQIRRLDAYRVARHLDTPQLNLAMNAPFSWLTLFRALHGKPVRQRNHHFIVEWIERFLPEKLVREGKTAAANDQQAQEREV